MKTTVLLVQFYFVILFIHTWQDRRGKVGGPYQWSINAHIQELEWSVC